MTDSLIPAVFHERRGVLLSSSVRWLVAGLLAALLFAAPGFVARSHASPGARSPAPRVAQADDAKLQKKRAMIRKRIRTMRAFMLTEELRLDETTAGKLYPILNRYDEKFVRVSAASRALRTRLQTLLRGETTNASTDAEINRAIDALMEQQDKRWELEKARFHDVRRVLTPQQSAQAMRLLPAIDRKIRRQIRRALRGQRDDPRRDRGRKHRGADGDRSSPVDYTE